MCAFSVQSENNSFYQQQKWDSKHCKDLTRMEEKKKIVRTTPPKQTKKGFFEEKDILGRSDAKTIS